jgi:hypothetical protein
MSKTVPIERTNLSVEKNLEFLNKAIIAVNDLFLKAKATNHVQFLMSATPNSREIEDPQWDRYEGLSQAYDDFSSYMKRVTALHIKHKVVPRIDIRIGLGFYCHLGEATSFYVIIKNMMLVAEGKDFSWEPFKHLVITGKQKSIPPGQGKILKDLISHSRRLKLRDLEESLENLFNAEMRNGYSHADYIICEDGIHFPNLANDRFLLITPTQFYLWLRRSMDFFKFLNDCIHSIGRAYRFPVEIQGTYEGQTGSWTAQFDSVKQVIRIRSVSISQVP